MTPAQITLVKAAIAADGVMSTQPASDIGTLAIMQWLNTADATYFVWKSTTDAATISDAITWANLTPVDTADGTATFTNRALVCQAKQINLQILLQGRDTVNSAKSNIRAGFQDALTNVPSGAGGTPLSAGWLGATGVKVAMTRNATLLEKILATGTGTSGTPASLGYEGQISLSDTKDIRNAA